MQASEIAYKNTKCSPLILSEEILQPGVSEGIPTGAAQSGGQDGMADGVREGEQTGISGSFICRGDNRKLMKTLLEEENMAGKIQLIYIDPPFFSKADYDAVLKAGEENIKHRAYGDKWEKGLSEYLKMLTARLLFMRDLLADTGLIWLHLDWHVVHYAKVIMDEIFGEKNFVNEIIWNYKSGGSGRRHFSRKHDTILVYAKSKKYSFYPLQEKSYNRGFKPYRFKGVKEYKDDTGWYTMVNMKDVWQIDMVGRTSGERTGYATQKPEQLLCRIIESCTKPGDLCADFFCGSGTLPAAAAKMGRRFIGCDSGSLAVESTISRLARQGASFQVFRIAKEEKSRLNARIEVSREEIPGSDKVLLRISLASLKEKRLAGEVCEKSREAISKVLKEDPLQMAAAWSVDFNYNEEEGVHRPQAVFVRNKGNLTTVCERIVPAGRTVCVKIVDILGNVTFERIVYEGNSKGTTD